jgi:ATP-dependent DNA helicase RecG
MDQAEFKRRIEKGEDLHTELKAAIPDQTSLSKAIVAFANSDGGQIFIGIGDRGEVHGVPDMNQASRLVDDVAFQRCEPPITVVQETVESGGRRVLVVSVPRGPQRPYRTGGGQYYVRSANRSRQASREEILRLFQSAESFYFDESAVFRASLKDLNLDDFAVFLETHFDIKPSLDEMEGYLRNLRLAQDDRPTVTGLLFFGRRPQDFLPSAKLIAAYIPATDIASPPADKKEIAGKIPELLEDASRFLRLYLKEEHRINGLESEIQRELPDASWREALVNGVAHRDYTISAPIRLLIFKDRVELRTPGGLPNTVTIDRIRVGGAHVLRNPTIYNLLARMGLVTDLGSGVRRIIRTVKDHLGKDVVLEDTGGEFVVTIPRRA